MLQLVKKKGKREKREQTIYDFYGAFTRVRTFSYFSSLQFYLVQVMCHSICLPWIKLIFMFSFCDLSPFLKNAALIFPVQFVTLSFIVTSQTRQMPFNNVSYSHTFNTHQKKDFPQMFQVNIFQIVYIWMGVIKPFISATPASTPGCIIKGVNKQLYHYKNQV